jgi:hypothetical protein
MKGFWGEAGQNIQQGQQQGLKGQQYSQGQGYPQGQQQAGFVQGQPQGQGLSKPGQQQTETTAPKGQQYKGPQNV